MCEIDNKKVIEANILYHSILAEDYDKSQPNFRPENIDKVDKILQSIALKTEGKSLVDLGCGTGFIINIAKKYFKKIVGVDITEKMIERVNIEGGNIKLYLSEIANTPLESGEFDVCTAYAVLHHIKDLKSVFAEAYRLLKPGGILYTDLDPNFYYWDCIKRINIQTIKNKILQGEIFSVINKDDEISSCFNLDKEIIALAEYHKMKKGGFEEEHIVELLKSVGFELEQFRYEWFLGQAYYLHNEKDNNIIIEDYLRTFLPATRHLFKYIAIYAKK